MYERCLLCFLQFFNSFKNFIDSQASLKTAFVSTDFYLACPCINPGQYIMKMVFILVMTLLSSTKISASRYKLLSDHKDVANGYFSSDIKMTGLENEDDPSANTYSVIGLFNNNSMLRNQYEDIDGNYAFKLIYRYSDGTNDTLIWTQKSWIANETIIGANLSQIPDQTKKEHGYEKFKGLALAGYKSAYIDGSPGNVKTYHSVGRIQEWEGGIPGDRVNQSAYSSSLYILNPNVIIPDVSRVLAFSCSFVYILVLCLCFVAL